MSVTLKNKIVTARKEYYDQCRDHLDFGILKLDKGVWSVNDNEADSIGIKHEDRAIIQKHIDRNFRILTGENHKYQCGVYDGDFYAVRLSLELSAILTKYNLWYED